MVRIQSDPRSNLARSTDDPHLPSQKGSAEDLTTWQARAAKQNPNKPGAGHVYVKMKGKATFGVDREKDPKGYYRAEAKAAKGTFQTQIPRVARAL